MKYLFSFILLLFSCATFAQNSFVYVRYNPQQGNASVVVDYIDNLYSGYGNVIVFFSNSVNPIVTRNFEDWSDLRSQILSMQIAPDYYEQEEIGLLNEQFTKYFAEFVEANKTIKGSQDKDWTFISITSENDFDEASSALSKIISVNQLIDRMKITHYTYNESNKLQKKVLNNKSEYNLNF